MRGEALRALASALVFSVAARFAELTVVWTVLASLSATIAVLCWFSSLVLTRSPIEPYPVRGLSEKTLELELAGRRTRWFSLLSFLLLALWVYSWYASGRLMHGFS